MHYLYFVAIKKEDEEKFDSLEIRNKARTLLDDNNFASEGGFWNNSKADWFVVGGRWSGELQTIQLKDWYKKAEKLLLTNKEEGSNFINNKDVENNVKELQELWEELGGKGLNSYARNNYQTGGFDDDCMLLDQKLFEALKIKDYADVEVAVCEDYVDEEMKMSDFLKDEKVVDNYYLVVIDYHN